MRVALFGYPGAGKSTLLRALGGVEETGKGGKGEGVCTVKVPDDRVDRVASLFRPKKVTHLSITFAEVNPGEPELLPPDALVKLRAAEVIVLVLRGFSDDFHPAPPGGVRPGGDLAAIEAELVLADYLVAQKRIERMAKEAKRDAEWTALHKAVAALEKETPLRNVEFASDEGKALAGFRFVSQPPLLAVVNVGEGDLGSDPHPETARAASERGIPLVRLCARIEEEISRLPPEEQAEFLRELGIERSARDRLIRAVLGAMEQITFITVGDEEVRAWGVRRGTQALAAAGKIHSDLEKGFIRAEVIGWEELLRFGSLAKARSEGKLRLEGKEYVLRDGEVLHVRFNV